MHLAVRVLSTAAIFGAAQAAAGDESLASGEVWDAGSLNVERRDTISVAAMSTQLAAVSAELSSLRATVSGGSSPLLLGIQAIANDMTARSNNLLTMTNGNSIGLASIQSTIDNAASTMARQTQSIRDEVAEQARQIDRSVALQLGNLTEQVDSSLSRFQSVQNGISRAAAANVAQITVATTNITALQANTGGKMISYQQCEHRGANGADSRSTVVLTCTFRKTRADTYWIISHNADTRQINGHSEWRMEVDGQPCTDRSNNNKGSLDASFHGAGPNMHRPMYIRGICYRTSSVGRIAAGNHAVRWRQTYTSGDSYWGWNSNARLMVEEWAP